MSEELHQGPDTDDESSPVGSGIVLGDGIREALLNQAIGGPPYTCGSVLHLTVRRLHFTPTNKGSISELINTMIINVNGLDNEDPNKTIRKLAVECLRDLVDIILDQSTFIKIDQMLLSHVELNNTENVTHFVTGIKGINGILPETLEDSMYVESIVMIGPLGSNSSISFSFDISHVKTADFITSLTRFQFIDQVISNPNIFAISDQTTAWTMPLDTDLFLGNKHIVVRRMKRNNETVTLAEERVPLNGDWLDALTYDLDQTICRFRTLRSNRPRAFGEMDNDPTTRQGNGEITRSRTVETRNLNRINTVNERSLVVNDQSQYDDDPPAYQRFQEDQNMGENGGGILGMVSSLIPLAIFIGIIMGRGANAEQNGQNNNPSIN